MSEMLEEVRWPKSPRPARELGEKGSSAASPYELNPSFGPRRTSTL